MKSDDVEKIVLIKEYQHFRYLVRAKSAFNAQVRFQTLMEPMFNECTDEYAIVYIDDHLIFRNGEERQNRH